MVSCHLCNSIRTLLSYQPKGLGQSGEAQKQHHLSPNPNQGVHSGGQSAWPLHDVGTPLPSQCSLMVSTMEEVVKQLTPLISTGPDWPYALVQLNGDAHHVPLPMEGHLSIMVEGSTSSVACRRISQLEGRRAGQHDYGGERAPIPGGTGYFWAHIREFVPKEARAHGLSHTSTS